MSDAFEKLSKINVNDKTERKGKFTYLSWAFAWAELKKVCPTASATVYHDQVTNKPYFADGDKGVIVKVGVTVDGTEHISYLPVMDFKNKAIPEEDVDMMDINKAIQRATVKAIGLHGLGLYIYAGEDLPEDAEDTTEAPKEAKEVVKRKAKKKTTKKVAKKKEDEEESEESEDTPSVAEKAKNSFRSKAGKKTKKTKGL